jgi:hypothetical protein
MDNLWQRAWPDLVDLFDLADEARLPEENLHTVTVVYACVRL